MRQGRSMAEKIEKAVILSDSIAQEFYCLKEENKEKLLDDIHLFSDVLSSIQKESTNENILVPLSLLQCIDDGSNPKKVSRELLCSLKKKNEEVNGKIQNLRDYRKMILEDQ